MSLFEAVQKFLMYLTITRGMSPRTVEQYGRHMWAFLSFTHPEVRKIVPKTFDLARFFSSQVSIQPENSKNASFETLKQLEKMSWIKTSQIDQHTCDHFRLSLAQWNISITTVNAYMISLRAFLHFCKKTHILTGIEFSDIELQKNRERKVEYLTSYELQSIVTSIGTEDISDLRDRAIILTIFSTGLRVSELTALDIKNVNLDTMEFAILGKGRKVRVVYLTEWACEAIRAYLEKREDHFPALFLKHGFKKMKNEKWKMNNGGFIEFDPEEVRFDRFLVTKMVSDRALKAGIVKPVSAHTIRHSFATTLLWNGADLRSIQELLGHKNIATTQVYTHVTNKQLREVHQKFHV
jgi:site-specific recombinase XerD